jgi:Right handed beta helix region/RTX calcium-binding nonapeptide repeat (4 copies)
MATLTVLASGALGNGTTTFSNLQDAVNAASNGDTIQLSIGEIDLEGDTDGHIDISKNLIIAGAGKDQTFIRAENPTAMCMIGVVGTAKVTFKDFTLDGSDGPLDGGVKVFAGITFIGNSVGTVENMAIQNIGEDSAGGGSGRGVFLLESSNVTIRNTHFSGNERDDVRVAESSKATIINSTFTAKSDLGSTLEQTREYGVRADGTSIVSITGSQFMGYVSTDLAQPSAAIRGSGAAKLTVSTSTFMNNLNAILVGTALNDSVELNLTGSIAVNVDPTMDLPGAVAVRGQGDGAFNGAEQITGNVPTVIFNGGGKDNIIRGGIGNDQLGGGGGNDLLAGRLGDDVLDGGADADTADYIGGSGGVTVTLTVTAEGTGAGSATGADGTDSLANIENVRGSNYDDWLTGNGFDNVLNGAGGADRMAGGGGNDTYIVGEPGDTVIETAGEGIDTVQSAVTFSLVGQEIENLTLTGTTNISGTGNGDANTLTGNNAANTLYGLGRNDMLKGSGGNDFLVGGAGSDTLFGDAGADTFDFNLTSESMAGAENRDTVHFFRTQGDKIDLSTINADSDILDSTVDIQSFRWTGHGGTDAFVKGVDGQLRFSGGVLQGDTNGDRIADIEIRIVGTLQMGDVIL